MAKSLRDIAKKVTPDIEQSTAMPPEKAKEKEFIDQHKINVHGELPWEKLGVDGRAKLGPDVGKKEEPQKVRESIEIDLNNLTEEQIEILSEISTQTLRSYIKKSSEDLGDKKWEKGKLFAKTGSKTKDDYEHDSWLANKAGNRRRGIARAVDKMVRKEEVEVLDELDRKTLKSYERKATTSRDREERKGDTEEDKAMETDGMKNPAKQNRHNANASAHFKKMIRRDRGLAMVKKRLNKEEATLTENDDPPTGPEHNNLEHHGLEHRGFDGEGHRYEATVDRYRSTMHKHFTSTGHTHTGSGDDRMRPDTHQHDVYRKGKDEYHMVSRKSKNYPLVDHITHVHDED